MRRLFVLVTAVLVAASAFAGPGAKPAKAPTTISCAVMTGGKVNIAEATKNHMYADFKGRRYFFCCGGCPEAFKKDPKKFAKSASIPTPKKAGKKA